jgi:hypothetical protein
MTSDLAVFQNIVSAKPKVSSVKNANWEKDCACNQEAPHSMSKASEDMSEPCKEAQQSDDFPHYVSFTKMPSAPSVPRLFFICS